MIFFFFELEQFRASCDECLKLCILCDDWLATQSTAVKEVDILDTAMAQDLLDLDFVMSVFTDKETQRNQLEMVLEINARLSDVLEQKSEAERKRVIPSKILIFSCCTNFSYECNRLNIFYSYQIRLLCIPA